MCLNGWIAGRKNVGDYADSIASFHGFDVVGIGLAGVGAAPIGSRLIVGVNCDTGKIRGLNSAGHDVDLKAAANKQFLSAPYGRYFNSKISSLR
jgi:hypothetical protein